MFFLENRIGLFLYHVLPNNIIWNWLSKKEKEKVLSNNIIKNNLTYIEPEKYSENHNQVGNPLNTTIGKFYAEWVNNTKPTVVLEIGPGEGFYTQILFERSEILEYDVIDCVEKFLTITAEKILNNFGDKTKITTYNGDFLLISSELPDSKYELILLSDSLHHLPNRIEIGKELNRILKPGGIVMSNEPTHYIPRVRNLLKLYLKFLWRGSKWYMSVGKPCTHHGLTLWEIRSIAKKSGLGLEFVMWNGKYLNNRNNGKYLKNSIFRFMSDDVSFILRKS